MPKRTFRSALSYCLYPLENRHHTRDRNFPKDISDNLKIVRYTFNSIFVGNDPIRVFGFPNGMRNAATHRGSHEEELLMKLPYVLTYGAEAQYDDHLGCDRTGTNYINSWPDPVQFLLPIYAKESHILRALNGMGNFKQG